jgi:hypothetical protein
MGQFTGFRPIGCWLKDSAIMRKRPGVRENLPFFTLKGIPCLGRRSRPTTSEIPSDYRVTHKKPRRTTTRDSGQGENLSYVHSICSASNTGPSTQVRL